MTESIVTVIPPRTEHQRKNYRQLRVAAYCRVSTEEEQQQSSYAAQCRYYTDKIMSNPAWSMAGIYADEGISGTSAQRRPEFLRMIQHCRQGKIDLILTKSISRFARNTVDCLHYIRSLKEMGISVIFEKENINTMESDSEMLITLLGAFAQAESESISQNVRWGKRQAMREGKVSFQYKHLYGFRRGEDGKPEIVPDQAEVVKKIFERFLAGDSIRMIQNALNGNMISNSGDKKWSIASVRSILLNEKYCGDVLMQKTFIADCISKKVVKNTGQLPMYLIQNHHEAIVSREVFDRAQAELARRNAGKSPSQKAAPTGKSCYTSKYALSDRLVCGECGTLYRRCTWSKNGKRRIVWRCVSRLDYGTKYCHTSPTLEEGVLQRGILTAINQAMGNREDLKRQLHVAMEQEMIPASGMTRSLGDIQRRLSELEGQFETLLASAAAADSMEEYTQQFQTVADEMAALKAQREQILIFQKENSQNVQRLNAAAMGLDTVSPYLTEWDESVVRQLVEVVRVISAEKIIVTIKGGTEIEQTLG